MVFISRPFKGGATRAAGGLGFVDGRVPGKAGFYNKGWVTEFNKKNGKLMSKIQNADFR